MRQFESETRTVVIDIGSATIKAGFAVDDAPRVVVPALAAVDECARVLPRARPPPRIGAEGALGHHGALKELVRRGSLVDSESAEAIADYVFEELKAKIAEEISVVLCLPTNAPRREMAIWARHFLEKANVAGLRFVAQPSLPLFGEGRTSGLALEAGHGLVQVAALVDGRYVGGYRARSEIGGADVEESLRAQLLNRGCSLRRKSEVLLLRSAKEALCRVRVGAGEGAERRAYALPDGAVVELSGAETIAAESLFAPSARGAVSLSALFAGAADALCEEIAPSVLQNIVFSGELWNLKGLKERVIAETRELSARFSGEKFGKVFVGRKFGVWNGGARIALSGDFAKTFIRRNQFEEFGENAIRRF